MSRERQSLRLRESMFLSALNDSSAVPPGFEAKRFQAASQQLHAKRLRMMAKAWPALPKALGEDWRRQAWAVLPSVRQRGDEAAMTDGFLVATMLATKGPLPRDLWIRMLLVRVRYRWLAGELLPRRQPAWLPDLVSRAVGRLYAAYDVRNAKARFALGEGD